MTRIITIASAKGGVGKTTLCANLAAGLAQLNRSVVAVDGNLTTSNLGIHLGIPLYPVTLQDVLKGRAELRAAMYTHPAGFRVVPADISIKKIMAPKSKELMNTFYELTGKVDYVLIDSAAGLGREARAAIEAADEIITITNPEMPALTDALKLIHVADKHGTRNLGVVVNRIKKERHEIPVSDVVDFLDLPLLGKVEDDPEVRRAIHHKEPVILHSPRCRAARQFRVIAAKVAGESCSSHSILHRLFGWL